MKTIHPIYDVYFRIEAGYNDGRMSHEQHDRFYTEIRALFSRAGFTILENPPGCPSFQLGTTCLYCHPTELSGPVEERHFLAAFRTSVPSKYHLRDEVLEELVRQLMVHTVRALRSGDLRLAGPTGAAGRNSTQGTLWNHVLLSNQITNHAMKIRCQEYFDAVVRYAESIGDRTLQECLSRLERWGKTLVRRVR